jgi:predicted alpha/beta superfamily hydrolase/DNA-binding beta-propeller fold protein YncE
MKKCKEVLRIILAIVLMTVSINQLKAQEKDSVLTLAVTKKIHSSILGEDRTVFIQTPARMTEGEKYPVLYLLDAEAHMEMVGGQVHYLSDAYRIVPNMIVVGIVNTDRVRDLTPTRALVGTDGKPDTSANSFGRNSGGGEKFLSFIKEELMPMLEKNYQAGPYKILSGHSLGALMAVHCLVNHPDYFNAYIAISPSLQWDNNLLLQQAAEKLGKQSLASRVLFFSNGNEDSVFRQNQQRLLGTLKNKALPGLVFKYMEYPEESHSAVPVKAFYDGLRLTYPDWYMPLSNAKFKQTVNAKIVRDHYAKLSSVYGYNVIPAHDEINAVGRFLRNDPKRLADAIELLEMNTLNFPNSVIARETLSDTYLKAGDKQKALAGYQKALLLKPAEKKSLTRSMRFKMKNKTVKRSVWKLVLLSVIIGSLLIAAYVQLFYQPRQVDNGYARLSKTFTLHGSDVWIARFVPNSTLLASGSVDSTVKIYDRQTGAVTKTFKHPEGVTYLDISRDGKLMATASYDLKIRIWDMASGIVIKTLEGHTRTPRSLSFSPDSKFLLSSGEDAMIKMWDVATGTLTRTISDFKLAVWDVKFSPHGKTFAAGSFDEHLRIYNTADGKELMDLKGHTATIAAVAYNHKGDMLASGSDDKTIKIWNTANGKLIRTISVPEHAQGLSFTPDDTRLLTSGRDKILIGEFLQTIFGDSHYNKGVPMRMWEMKTGKLLQTFCQQANDVNELDVSEDGKWVASASSDHTVCVWEMLK